MLKGKVAIITGGSKGIGFATVKKFLDNGAKVAFLAKDEGEVNEAFEELKIEYANHEVLGFSPNLAKEAEVIEVFEKVKEKYGKIDILINNAGISSKTKIEDYTEDEYDRISNLNIKGVFVCSKVAIPYLKETQGVIINASSMVSIYGQSAGVMYPASKWAVNGITKSLSRELAKYKIRVNAVAPGVIETDMLKSLPREMIDPLIASIPLGRIGKPEDIANAYLFLASDLANYVTGEILSVDGAARS